MTESNETISENEKEMTGMPMMETMEFERTAYIKGMEEYLQKLRSMPNQEAVVKSRRNLESCHIIQEDGQFTERYRYSRMNTR